MTFSGGSGVPSFGPAQFDAASGRLGQQEPQRAGALNLLGTLAAQIYCTAQPAGAVAGLSHARTDTLIVYSAEPPSASICQRRVRSHCDI